MLLFHDEACVIRVYRRLPHPDMRWQFWNMMLGCWMDSVLDTGKGPEEGATILTWDDTWAEPALNL